MAKKAPAAKKKVADGTQQLVEAIATVKHLQDFIAAHGGLEKALEVVAGVYALTRLTGGFDQLKQALEIVGKVAAPPQA